MANYPVTLGQYEKLNTYNTNREFAAKEKTHAVNYISCKEAEGWIDFLNAKRPTKERDLIYRLPRENEWEYACRAGSSSRFYYGDDPSFENLNKYAWFSENVWDQNKRTPQPVGRKLPNSFGLYDMHGNVWEWTSDGWASYSEIISSGNSIRNPNFRVLRGGGWCHEGKYLRSSDRDYYELGYSHYYTGFRIVASFEG